VGVRLKPWPAISLSTSADICGTGRESSLSTEIQLSIIAPVKDEEQAIGPFVERVGPILDRLFRPTGRLGDPLHSTTAARI
jgi:hypothetical protein